MKQLFTFLLATLLFTEGFAQVQVNNELKQLINRSFGYFPKVKEAENAVITAGEKIALTQLANSVSVNAAGSYLFIDPSPKVTFPINGEDKLLQFQPQHNFNTSLTGNYTLADFGRLKAAVERSKDELQYAKHNTELVKFQLANQVAAIYYTICYLQKAIGVQDSILHFLEENKKIVAAKIKDGDGLKLDALNIQANIDNEDNRKTDLINSLQKQQNLLAYTTGTNTSGGNGFDFDLPAVPLTASVATAVENNIDFLLIKDKIKQSEHDIAVTSLQDKPIINLNAGAGFRNGIQPDIAQFRFNYLAGVSLVVPVYTGGKSKQQIKLQQTILKQQELAMTSLQSNYQKDIEQTYSDITTTTSRINNTKGQIELAKYAQQLAAFRYKNGVGTNVELVNAGANVQRAALTRLQYQYQLCLAKVELAKLTGVKYW